MQLENGHLREDLKYSQTGIAAASDGLGEMHFANSATDPTKTPKYHSIDITLHSTKNTECLRRGSRLNQIPSYELEFSASMVRGRSLLLVECPLFESSCFASLSIAALVIAKRRRASSNRRSTDSFSTTCALRVFCITLANR